MSEQDVVYWTMIGTWVAGLATFLAVVVSLYLSVSSRKTKLSITLVPKSGGGYEIDILNRGHVYGEVRKMHLVQRRLLSQDLVSEDSEWGDLISYYLFDMEDDIKKQTALIPSEPSSKLEVSKHILYQQYAKFLPYENGVLTHPTTMKKCHIKVLLMSGEKFYVPLPSDFYMEYREHIGSSLDQELYRLTNNPEMYFSYHSSSDLRDMQARFLDRYSQARKNYHLLLC